MSNRRSESIYIKLRIAVAIAALQWPVHLVARRFQVTRGFVRYWLHRLVDPLWHAGTLGGVRRSKFSQHQLNIIWVLLHLEIRADPVRSATQFARELVRLRLLHYITLDLRTRVVASLTVPHLT
jgi:transposase